MSKIINIINKIKSRKTVSYNKDLSLEDIKSLVSLYMVTKFPCNFTMEYNYEKFNKTWSMLINNISRNIYKNIKNNLEFDIEENISLYNDKFIENLYSIDSCYINSNTELNGILISELKEEVRYELSKFIPIHDVYNFEKVVTIVSSMIINGLEYDDIEYFKEDISVIYNTYQLSDSLNFYNKFGGI